MPSNTIMLIIAAVLGLAFGVGAELMGLAFP